MSETVRVRITYLTEEAFFENGTKVNEIIEKDTGRHPIQSRSLPPYIVPQELSPDAIEKLKVLKEMRVENLPDD
ncbi:hypothetical protein BDV38DRAFT_244234, partial [Aspergillus pseudotamarii]